MKHILNLKGAIERHGLLMKDIAERMGVTPSALSRKSSSIRTDTAIKISEAIGCDLFELWDTYDDDGVLIPISELYPKKSKTVTINSDSQNEVKEKEGNEQRSIFEMFTEGPSDKEDIFSHENTNIYFPNIQNQNQETQIAGYGKCPKCGARFKIVLDEG